MEKAIRFSITLLFVIVALVSCKSSDPLAKQRAIEEFDQKIEAKRYTFVARHAYPMSGRNISLTPDYTLEVTPDTISAYLPYFGRAYSAPMSSTDGGIKFTSTKFDYQLSEKEKGVYRVTINILDNPNDYRLSILLGENGTGTVHVNQKDKQSISFQGVIE